MYLACGSNCPPTCSLPNRRCIERCTPGCFCKPGYIRDDNSGMCIPAHECQKGRFMWNFSGKLFFF